MPARKRKLSTVKPPADIAYHLSGNYLSACDLPPPICRLFSAVAQGQLKPKNASTLAYLGQTLAHNPASGQGEYINAYGNRFLARDHSHLA